MFANQRAPTPWPHAAKRKRTRSNYAATKFRPKNKQRRWQRTRRRLTLLAPAVPDSRLNTQTWRKVAGREKAAVCGVVECRWCHWHRWPSSGMGNGGSHTCCFKCLARRSISAVIDVWMSERIMNHLAPLAKHNPINRNDKVPIWMQTMRPDGGRPSWIHILCLRKGA